MGGLVFFQQTFRTCLQMSVTGASPPDVDSRIGSFGTDLVEDFACAPANHRNLDTHPGFESPLHGHAPSLIDATKDVQLGLGHAMPCAAQP
jgi:hypothetical protein